MSNPAFHYNTEKERSLRNALIIANLLYYFAAISAFKASVNAGTILFKSPTKP